MKGFCIPVDDEGAKSDVAAAEVADDSVEADSDSDVEGVEEVSEKVEVPKEGVLPLPKSLLKSLLKPPNRSVAGLASSLGFSAENASAGFSSATGAGSFVSFSFGLLVSAENPNVKGEASVGAAVVSLSLTATTVSLRTGLASGLGDSGLVAASALTGKKEPNEVAGAGWAFWVQKEYESQT
jgi:hypothetical protein